MAKSTISGIAILGAGLFVLEGRFHLYPLLLNIHPCLAHLPALAELGPASPALKAVYSRSETSASQVAQKAVEILGLSETPDIYFDSSNRDLEALLSRSDVEAVIIALPITVQPEIILKCLSAGKHVLSEKPLAPDVAQGIKLIQDAEPICKDRSLVWRVAENFEAEPIYRTARDAIRAGKIGDVVFFKASVFNYLDKTSKWYKTPWRTVPDYQGGFLLDGGVHTIAALRTILPHSFTQLSGFASLNKEYLAPHDTIHSVIKAGSHYHGIVEMTFASPTKSTPVSDNIVVTGTDGWLACNRSSDGFKVVIKSRVREEGKPEDEQKYEEKEEAATFPSKGVETELVAFFGKIENKSEALDIGSPKNALTDVAFIQAALNSQGNLIDLDNLVQAL
ncbi:hypothetical protein D9757_002569 [Collybiopsis confluens]|uniref:Oxidoreductase n=1 Tax=Collybiopsis confluens TaxID=2823264 RepID=A0A8H5HWX8_9AGAR|nr:hypothetical protein D9757_002569 [Collybiopsis confluens]